MWISIDTMQTNKDRFLLNSIRWVEFITRCVHVIRLWISYKYPLIVVDFMRFTVSHYHWSWFCFSARKKRLGRNTRLREQESRQFWLIEWESDVNPFKESYHRAIVSRTITNIIIIHHLIIFFFFLYVICIIVPNGSLCTAPLRYTTA